MAWGMAMPIHSISQFRDQNSSLGMGHTRESGLHRPQPPSRLHLRENEEAINFHLYLTEQMKRFIYF